MGIAQQHEIRQRRFAVVGPSPKVMSVDGAAVGVTDKTAGANQQQQSPLDCGSNRLRFAADRPRPSVGGAVGAFKGRFVVAARAFPDPFFRRRLARFQAIARGLARSFIGTVAHECTLVVRHCRGSRYDFEQWVPLQKPAQNQSAPKPPVKKSPQ